MSDAAAPPRDGSPDLGEVLTAAIDDAIAALIGDTGSGSAVAAASSDGFVAARVSPGGALVSLDVDVRILRGGTDRLTSGVIEAYNAAREASPPTDVSARRAALQQAKQRTQDAMAGVAGALQDTLRRVVTDAGGEY